LEEEHEGWCTLGQPIALTTVAAPAAGCQIVRFVDVEVRPESKVFDQFTELGEFNGLVDEVVNFQFNQADWTLAPDAHLVPDGPHREAKGLVLE
jgi:hypothetical protein